MFQSYGWLVELLLGVGVLVCVQLILLPGDPGLVSATPHPLLGLAVWLAVRFGTAPGLLAGLLLALIHLTFQIVALPVGGSVSALRFGPPVQIVLVAAILGQLVRGRVQELARLRELAATERRRAETLEAKLQLAVERQLALERRGLDPAAQVALLHRGAAQLDSLEEEELFPAILGLLSEQLDVDAAEIYAFEPTGLTLRAARGGAELPARRDIQGGLIGLALAEQRVVSARDLLQNPELVPAREETVIAAPLLSRTGEALGVLNVRALPFARLTPSTLRVVEMLTNWGARALERARLVQQLRPTDPRLAVHTYAHFCERLASEFWRSRRYDQPLTILVLTLIDCEELAPEAALRVRQTVAQLLLKLVRNVDLVACYRDAFGFVVLLPATDRSGGLALRGRVVEAVERFQLKVHGNGSPLAYLIGVASLTGEMGSPVDLESLAEDVAAAPDLPAVIRGSTEAES